MITNVTRVKIRRDIKHKIQCMSRYQDIKTLIYKTEVFVLNKRVVERNATSLTIISEIYCETINGIERTSFLMNSSLARNLPTSSLYLYIFLQT